MLGFVIMDGSPVCGLNHTHLPKDKDVLWGGLAIHIPESEYLPGQGGFSDVLHEELTKHKLAHLPMIAYPEMDQGEAGQAGLKALRALIG